MSNKNCDNMKNSDSCDSCNDCNDCNSCNSCNSCDSCYSCNYCDSCYSCYFSSGLRMSEKMIFCFGESRWESKGEGYQKHLRIFNQDVTEEEFSKAQSTRPKFELPIAKWVDKKDMTDDEKENWTSHSETGGYLKTLSYKDAWKEVWPKASKEFKSWVKNLPHFDAGLFEKITGVKWAENGKKEELLKKASELIEKANELKEEAEKL